MPSPDEPQEGSVPQPTQPRGYLATPAAGTGPAVLVLHAWWGLNDTTKAICDRLAMEGFVAFAPDLYHGKVGSTIEEAKALSGKLDSEGAKADIAEAVAFLAQRAGSGSPRLGVIGFSLGAYFALQLSVDDPDQVRAVVLFYGTGVLPAERSKASYLGHFAQSDPFEPASAVTELSEALDAAGRPATFHIYASTGHWFFEPDRPDAYNEAAARLAWERTVAFLKNVLGTEARAGVSR